MISGDGESVEKRGKTCKCVTDMRKVPLKVCKWRGKDQFGNQNGMEVGE